MIFEKIQNIMVEQLEIDKESITLDSTLTDLNVDSLSLFQIIIDIEEAFNIQIEDTDDIATVNDVVKIVEDAIKSRY